MNASNCALTTLSSHGVSRYLPAGEGMPNAAQTVVEQISQPHELGRVGELLRQDANFTPGRLLLQSRSENLFEGVFNCHNPIVRRDR